MRNQGETGADRAIASVRLEGLTKRFGDVVAVDAIDLAIPDGQFFSMLGPSGSGKTTTLRMIAGFELPTAGRILLHGDDVVVYAFNVNRVPTWPPSGFTLDWWSRALNSEEVRSALALSLQAALGATAIALVLGTLASLGVQRYAFFGRETVSFLVILPLALPGIVTGIALNAAFRTLGVELGVITIVIGHATFCIVVIYNNVLARLRRTSRSIEEASMDLGADTWQTFRYVTLPSIRTALVAGGLLAFALSFDEVIVTTFTAGTQATLPIFILSNYLRPNQAPIVNVVAVVIVLLSAIPVYVASRLSGDTGSAPATR